MTKPPEGSRIYRRLFRRTLRCAFPVLLAGLTVAAAGEPGPSQPAASGQEAAREPDPALVPFLGTWLMEETIVRKAPATPFRIHHHILIRWHNNRLRIKTLEYLPDLGTRNHVSDWNGTVPIDRWNQWKQTFVLMPDGTISVGLSGTNGFGVGAANFGWWASGSFVLLEDDEDGPQLRFYTDRGYSPTSKGNAWRPLDRTYHLVSREIDSKYLPPRRKY